MTGYEIVAILFAASLIMMVLERRGLPTTLSLTFKGDVKRESRFLAQYGQLVCTGLVALLIWQIDLQNRVKICLSLLAATGGATGVSIILKRLLGRARPRRENAGKFLGPSWKHANYRESFPSSHSASAIAFSTVMSHAYPHAAATFWALGLICAILRYIMDAHWPSDVLAGIAMGYLGGILAWQAFH